MAKPMSTDPAIGVWKLDVDKSTFALTPAPQSRIMTVEPWGDGLKVSAIMIDMWGNKFNPQTAYKFDGRDYPLQDSPLADTISVKKINERTKESIWKKQGKVIFTERTVVSVDGKTLNATRVSTDVQGCPVNDVLVYERQ